MDELILFVNSKKVVIKNPDPETTLLQFIRNELQLKGTKLGCGEGGCGACTVMVTRYDYNDKTFKHISVNACLAPLCLLHGMAVTTVEGLGSVTNGLHPVQERLAKSHGSQCGFCTPGFVMSMYSLLCNDPHPTESSMEKAFEGNLCRCTGYRPILEGFRTFVGSEAGSRGNGHREGEEHLKVNGQFNGELRNKGDEHSRNGFALDNNKNAGSSQNGHKECEGYLKDIVQCTGEQCTKPDKCSRNFAILNNHQNAGPRENGHREGAVHLKANGQCNGELRNKGDKCRRNGFILDNQQNTGSIQNGLRDREGHLKDIAQRNGEQCTKGDKCSRNGVTLDNQQMTGSGQNDHRECEVHLKGSVQCNGEQCTKPDKCSKYGVTLDIQRNDSRNLFNTEEFAPFNPDVHLAQPIKELELIAEECDKQSLVFKSDRVTWHRPTSLNDLMKLKDRHPNAKIVIGNTEIGVEVKFKNMHYPVIIAATNIHELNSVQHLETGIRIGASVTLKKLESVLKEAITQTDECKTRIFAAVVEMFRWFAGTQVRNVASVGGNIVTASPISDLNPLFLSAGCTLTLASLSGGTRTIKMDDEFFVGYRKTKIQPNEVLLFIDIPFTRENEYFRGYKQSQRREDDIAIVNAGMRVLFEDGSTIIKDIALSYGGMAPFTVMANKTANQLKGRKWEDDLIPVATQLLADELPLAPGTPGGMEAYRCSLIMSFFYKFYLTVRVSLQQKRPALWDTLLSETHMSATREHYRDASHGVQVYEETPQGQIKVDAVGRPLPHMSALRQVTGEAVYIDDIPAFKGEYYLSLVISTKAHAKILNVDPSKALLMPGVVDYISWKDIPGQNKAGPVIQDEKVFAEDMVTSQGTVIGAVLADNQVHAQRAAKAVKVEYEKLKPIITIEDAIAAGSFHVTPRTVTFGDVDGAMTSAEHVMEGEFRMGGQEHFYLETHATLAVPSDGDGEMEIYCGSQNPGYLQRAVATVLGIGCNKIACRVKRLGGGFGGKESRFTVLALPVAVAAHKHKRPVRCMLDREEDMVLTGTRHPYLVKYKVGFTSKGKVEALEIHYYQNSGDTVDLSTNVMKKSLLNIDNAYNIQNIRMTGYVCRTNIPSNTAFRGFGAPQGTFTCENVIDEIARTLRICPQQVRELNMYKEGDRTFYNQTLVEFTLPRCWNDVIRQSNYEKRKQHARDFNSKNRWLKRGLSVIPVKFGIRFEMPALNTGFALVHIYLDGSVLLSFSAVEMGQGINTKMIQVASRVLKIPTSRIYVSECSTSHCGNAPPTAASVGSDLNGMAVLEACQALMERLFPYIKANPKGPWETWINSAFMDRVCLSSTGFYTYPGLSDDWETNTDRFFAYYTMGAACSEVEIDCLTGDHKVLSTDIVMDVGKSLNPAIDIGQIEGAFLQGYGYYTIEEQKYSTSGYLYTRGPGTYKIPSVSNIPVEFNVTLLKDAPNPKAVYSSKGIGEPPLFLSSSIFFAIKEAVNAARKEAGLEGTFRLDSPATAERIRMACTDDFTKRNSEPIPGTFTPWFVKL